MEIYPLRVFFILYAFWAKYFSLVKAIVLVLYLNFTRHFIYDLTVNVQKKF